MKVDDFGVIVHLEMYMYVSVYWWNCWCEINFRKIYDPILNFQVSIDIAMQLGGSSKKQEGSDTMILTAKLSTISVSE